MLFSVFLFYFLMPYVVYHIKLPGINEWFTGPVVTLMLVLPLVIAQGKGYKKCIFPMVAHSYRHWFFHCFYGTFPGELIRYSFILGMELYRKEIFPSVICVEQKKT